ncbi:hypothetical protein [Rhodococcus spongiicola]|uniref:Uncharacterized protein n=1 Tax=Rhodococcus spongiicola TaxID=2487352 RepID=A0A3S3CVC5_9NOCA|nr:hypothetical protein [Rhodococcus spongiicola]RVW06533.1 hypothetical protein EF834_03755 [Rhodococcus spongiicola]
MNPLVDRGEPPSVACLHPDTVVRTDDIGPYELCHDCHRVVDDRGQWDPLESVDDCNATLAVVVCVSAVVFTAALVVGLLGSWRFT